VRHGTAMILDYRRPKRTQRTAYSSIPRKLNRSTIWIACVILLLARHERLPAAQCPLPQISGERDGGEKLPAGPPGRASRTRRAATKWRTRSAAEGCSASRRAYKREPPPATRERPRTTSPSARAAAAEGRQAACARDRNRMGETPCDREGGLVVLGGLGA
jgi:hypothetical protein